MTNLQIFIIACFAAGAWVYVLEVIPAYRNLNIAVEQRDAVALEYQGAVLENAAAKRDLQEARENRDALLEQLKHSQEQYNSAIKLGRDAVAEVARLKGNNALAVDKIDAITIKVQGLDS